MTIIKCLIVLLSLTVTDILAGEIGDYLPAAPVTNIPHGSRTIAQVSAVFIRGDETCILQNGGGKLTCRTDMLDPDTKVISKGSMAGCGDIEGGWAFGDYDLFADERTPARIYFMFHGGSKCSEAPRTLTLAGMDETSGSWGIEGISELKDGRFVVVKENSPERVAVFTLVDGIDNYSPVDLFTVINCERLGDVTVRNNGNILVICKLENKVQEYTLGGVLVSELQLSFNQPEGYALIGLSPYRKQAFIFGDLADVYRLRPCPRRLQARRRNFFFP